MSMPQPKTAMVLPLFFKAPLWAAASIPLAIPLTTVTPAPAKSPAKVSAIPFP
ncbi:hypothetical protein ES703_31781 [subsurface metagenome]